MLLGTYAEVQLPGGWVFTYGVGAQVSAYLTDTVDWRSKVVRNFL